MGGGRRPQTRGDPSPLSLLPDWEGILTLTSSEVVLVEPAVLASVLMSGEASPLPEAATEVVVVVAGLLAK